MMSTINWNKMTGEEFEKDIGEEYLSMLGIEKIPVMEYTPIHSTMVSPPEGKQVGWEWGDDVDVLYYCSEKSGLDIGKEQIKENAEFKKVEVWLSDSGEIDDSVLCKIRAGQYIYFKIQLYRSSKFIFFLLFDMKDGDFMFAKAHKDKLDEYVL